MMSAILKLFSITDVDKLSVSVWPAVVFGGEYNINDPQYAAFLQSVSYEAMRRNMDLVGVIQNEAGLSFKQAIDKLRTNPDHYSSPHVDQHCALNHLAKLKAGTTHALDIFYNHKKYIAELDGPEAALAEHWIGKMHNRQAVCNRRLIAITKLVESIRSVKDPVVRIFSLGGGDAQVLIEAIRQAGRKVKVCLVDPDKEALKKALDNARVAGFADCFEVKRGLAKSALKHARDFMPHVFDVVGLMDYFKDHEVIKVASIAKETLVKGRALITANINDNPERIFLEWVLLWFMKYRTPYEFGELMAKGGFAKRSIEVICEPFQIHEIAICKNV
jgi:hypothetical protein